MLKRTSALCLSGILCLGLLVVPAMAQEKAIEGDPAMQAMMEAYTKAATPGVHHEHLNYFAGKWKLTCTSYCMGPEPTSSPGSATFRWILDKRFMIQDVEGVMDGMPFHGFGVNGYDNVLKKYTGVWCDSMGTGLMTSIGTCDASGKNWTYEAEWADPIAGKPLKYKQEMKIINDTTFTFTMHGPGPDGNEMKMMEITYERM